MQILIRATGIAPPFFQLVRFLSVYRDAGPNPDTKGEVAAKYEINS